MDWFIDIDDEGALSALRHEFTEYLRRHGSPDSDFLGAALAFSELLANAMEYAKGPIWVSIDWLGEAPVLTVHDLGPGFRLEDVPIPDAESPRGRGLFIVSHLTRQLSVAAKRAGGSRVQAVLPVSRSVERSHAGADPGPGHHALPSLDEAETDGTFGREAFLRALTVQLAQAVEAMQGPAIAEAGVTEVGAEVSRRMEDAYRRSRAIMGRLTPEQMGDLFVRLKAGIGGAFYVIDTNEERIVLGNRRCPFGDAIRRAPALCRMTSSVFGGIAARNARASGVELQERIAVGDPECRVVVWLAEPPPEAVPFVHSYGRPLQEQAGPVP